MAKEIERTHALSVGDCLKAVWGHDQTNVDYYQVVALNGRTMVTVREIAQNKKPSDGNFMVGETSPINDVFIGRPFRAKPFWIPGMGKVGIRITSFSNAVKCKWGDVSRWSSYA